MLLIVPERTQDYGPCDCCGSMSRLIAGLVTRDGDSYAGYQVQWTLGQIEKHGATFFVILGKWGEGTITADRFAVAVRYRSDTEASGFMIIDADATRIASHPLVGAALRRDDVIGTQLAHEVFEIVDLIWLNDHRIAEFTGVKSA
jgi:hypothetical protein